MKKTGMTEYRLDDSIQLKPENRQISSTVMDVKDQVMLGRCGLVGEDWVGSMV